MKTLMTIAVLIMGASGVSYAECPTDQAVKAVAQNIKDFQNDIKEAYGDVKYTSSWGSVDGQPTVTTVLFTYTSYHQGETPDSGTRIGYAFFDAACNSLGSENSGDAGTISK